MKAKKRLASGVLAAGMLLSVALPAMPVQVQATPATGMQLCVAPNGSDSAAGTIDAPLQTLEGARDKIRAIKAESGLPEGGITVNLREGDYKYLESSFTLGEQDSGAEGSPIVYQAYPGETVTLSGNVEASGADFEPVTDESILARLPESVHDKVLVYDVTGNLGISEFSPLPKNGFGWPDQPAALNITVDGEAQTLARYPNDGFVNIDKAYSAGFIPRNHMPNPDGSCPECTKANGGERIPCKIGEDNWINQAGGVWGSRALADKYELWSQESDIWTFGYFWWDWADDNIGIKELELDGDMLKFTGEQPSRYGVQASGRRFYAYNLLCEIDQPGEWYLDRENGQLYIYPEKDLSSSTVELSMMGSSFIKAENAEYIQFKNLDISKGNSHGIELVDCSNMLVAGCDFSDLGQRAVVIGKIVSADSFSVVSEGAQGGHDNIVQSCDIQRTGQGGVYLAGGNRYSLTPANSKVINCSFDDYAVVKRTYSPAIALMGTGLEASNNKITNAPHMAISFDGNDNVIKNNEIAHVCYETSDSGAIYSVRRWSYRGNVITNNYIHDMVSNNGIGSAAVYLDDLMCGTEVTNNLFVNVTGYTTLIGGGRDNIVKNNIQINQNNGKGLHYDARGLGWAHYHAASPDGTCFAEWAALKNTLEQTPENWAKWQEKYPELTEMSLELDGASECIEGKKPANAVITGNLLVGVSNPFGNIDGNVKSMGTFEANESYPAGTDIGFVDPSALNFEVKEGSLIKEKLGDEHFDASCVSLYKDEYRTELGVEVTAPVLESPADQAEDVSLVEGVEFSWQAVEGAGSYQLEIAEDEKFEQIVQASSVTGTSATAKDLETGKTYYWRVTAYEARLGGSSAVSEVRSFTTSTSTDASFYESFGNDFSAWTPAEGGTKGTPSNTTEQAHAGRHSYVQDEAMDAIEKTFGIPQQQVVTLWLYDNMNSGKQARAIANVSPNSGKWLAMGVSVPESPANYAIRTATSFTATEVPRSEGWHELKWDYTSGTDCKMYIDGIEVATVPEVNGVGYIVLGDLWNGGGQAGDIGGFMFDDLKLGDPVIDPAAKSVSISEQEIQISVGAQHTLTAVVEADPDVAMEVEWTQGEHEIARVDENGVVTCMRAGTTNVTVSVKGFPDVKAQCRVTVVDDKSELVTAIQNGQEYLGQTDKYTAASLEVLEQAVAAGQQVLNDSAATEQQVKDAVDAIESAIAGLVELGEGQVDKSMLDKHLARADELLKTPDMFTEETLKVLQEAAEAARQVQQNTAATQEEVDNAAAALASAIDQLQLKQPADKQNLQKAVQEAQAKLQEVDKYTQESLDALRNAVSSAETVLADKYASQQEVDAQEAAVREAIAGLQLLPPPVVKDELARTIRQAKEFVQNENEYTTESIARLKEALQAAQTVCDDPNADQAQVDAATVALRQSIEQLEKKPEPADKTLLQASIQEAERLLQETDRYTAESVQNLKTALSAAKRVMEDEDAVQSVVDSANAALQKAISGLQAKPETADKQALWQKMKEASDYAQQTQTYTEASIQNLKQVLSQAVAVLNDAGATQQQVDDMTAQLQKAIESLQKKDGGETGGDGGSEGSGDGSGNGNGGDTSSNPGGGSQNPQEDIPQTGDTAPYMLLVLCFAGAAALGAVLVKRVRKQ